MNNNKILFMSLLLIFHSAVYSNNIKGTVFLETNYLKLKSRGNHISKSNWINIWKNKEAILDSNYYEEYNNIYVDDFSTGLFARGEGIKVVNNGTIILNKNGVGMEATDSAVMENSSLGIIDLKADGEIGMLSSSSGIVVNNGTIKLSGGNNFTQVGMKAIGTGVAENKGDIIINGGSGFGMTAVQGATIINKGNILLKDTSQDSQGIAVGENSYVLNEGKIEVNTSQNGFNTAISAGEGSTLKTTKGSSIVLNGDFNMGIRLSDAKLINEGKIEVNGEGNTAIYLNGKETIELSKDSTLALNGDSNIGVVFWGSNKLLNAGNISISGSGNVGISGLSDGIIESSPGSTIVLNGNDNIGIQIFHGKLLNGGDILISGNGNTGILAGGTSEVINTGTINIISGENNIGINIQQGASLENKGTIIIKGTDVTNNPDEPREDGNIGISNEGTIINSGNFIFSGDFDSNDLGSGSLIMKKNSNLEADKISGEIKLSSDITEGSLENEYSTDKMFKTKEMYGKLISTSLLFDAELKHGDDYYDGILKRKNFKEVVYDKELGNYLEKNYIDDNNQNKIEFYDKFKRVTSDEEMDNLVKDTFGKTIFPTLEKQTFEIIRLNNNILKSNISKKSIDEDFQYIVGGAYNRIDSDSSNIAEGYISSLKNIWIGGEKKISKTTKTGVVLSIGDYISNFAQNSHRKDRIIQGTFFINYDKNNLNLRTFATFGETKADLDRVSRSYSQKLNSDFDSQYFVLSNEISKTFNFENNIYIIPKGNLNLYRSRQGEIKEKNGKYPVEIDSIKSVIFEPGGGITIGKNIFLNRRYILKPELEFNYFHRIGDLRNNLKGKIKSVSNDSFTLRGYEFEKNSGDGKIKISLEKGDWSTYISYSLLFENKVSSLGTIGINYKL